MAHSFKPHRKLASILGAMLALPGAPAVAQTAATPLQPITVTGRAAPQFDVLDADVSGFDLPLARTPQSITVLSADLLSGLAAGSLSQALRLDGSLTDNYNTTGFIESLSIRGFQLDQVSNFRRNGLAVSNYAPLALENMERVEVLKGVAGLQSGVSAPGGLVNYVTKVPQKDAFVRATLAADGNGGSKIHLDTNALLGSIGVRLNLLTEQLHSHFDRADGTRQLAAVAMAAAPDAATALSASLEYQRKSQASVPGLGLLDSNGDGVGDTLPAGGRSRLNLNNQSWSQPFEVASTTAQIALARRLNVDWQWRVSASTQRTSINDRIAFPDGCSSAANYVYPGLCGNGDVDIYDYRSEGEQRTLSSWDVHLHGRLNAAGIEHRVRVGLSGHLQQTQLPAMLAYNFVGTTNIDAPLALPADPALTALNTNSNERTLEAYATLSSELTRNVQSLVGLRVSRLHRASALSDASQAVSYEQTAGTPWAALTWTPRPGTSLYASWGQGLELEAVPNRPALFANYGQTLPALKSEQIEIGAKWQALPRLLLSAAIFNIDKPFADDLAGATVADLPSRVAGAKVARHRGLELSAVGQVNRAWSIQASMMALDAVYLSAVNPQWIGQAVTNVPRFKGSVFVDYKVAAHPGLSLNALASFESAKPVTVDASVALPRSWQIDAGLHYQQMLAGRLTQWRVNVENLTNREYWHDAPTTSWGGIYLFPATPRTVRASLTVDF